MGGERQKAGLLIFADGRFFNSFLQRCHGKMHGGFDRLLMNRTVERREGTLLSIWQTWLCTESGWNVCSFCNFTKPREEGEDG